MSCRYFCYVVKHSACHTVAICAGIGNFMVAADIRRSPRTFHLTHWRIVRKSPRLDPTTAEVSPNSGFRKDGIADFVRAMGDDHLSLRTLFWSLVRLRCALRDLLTQEGRHVRVCFRAERQLVRHLHLRIFEHWSRVRHKMLHSRTSPRCSRFLDQPTVARVAERLGSDRIQLLRSRGCLLSASIRLSAC
ncbi:hypothetical protein KOR42_18960 [Thalassoglobus neptunius]|uniref:Uncharacterized protein n=1 Tax=Thalassoglobus neptunius TaxID=1938619 RepID=A0A5C5X666_9PLAN|nr:hypothetical protein KOR42_18960 [Thalassoglobus neptunius]